MVCFSIRTPAERLWDRVYDEDLVPLTYEDQFPGLGAAEIKLCKKTNAERNALEEAKRELIAGKKRMEAARKQAEEFRFLSFCYFVTSGYPPNPP